MKQIQKIAITMFTASLLAIGIAGCDKPEAPAKTRTDVTEARVDGQKDVTEARQDAAENIANAQKDVGNADADLAHEAAKGQQAVMVAQAEANYKVAIEKCDALTDDSKSTCKKRADADLETQKASAKSTAIATDPKP